MRASVWMMAASVVIGIGACFSSPEGDNGEGIGADDIVSLVDGETPVENSCDGQADGLPCDDGDACTLSDACDNELCVGLVSNPCDEEGPCRIGSCDPATGCNYTDATDGWECAAACFGSATCEAGSCVPDTSTEVECPEPTDPCVAALTCEASTGECTESNYAPEGTSCDADDNVCTLEACDGAGSCEDTGGTEDCLAENTNNPCWTWTCSPETGCVQTIFVEGVNFGLYDEILISKFSS